MLALSRLARSRNLVVVHLFRRSLVRLTGICIELFIGGVHYLIFLLVKLIHSVAIARPRPMWHCVADCSCNSSSWRQRESTQANADGEYLSKPWSESEIRTSETSGHTSHITSRDEYSDQWPGHCKEVRPAKVQGPRGKLTLSDISGRPNREFPAPPGSRGLGPE